MKRKIQVLAAGLAAAMLASAVSEPVHAADAPEVGISRFGELHRPLPFPFDDSADASAEVDAAMATAKEGGRLVLIEFGANWCVDCRLLHGVMDLPEMKTFVDAHYVPVTVDIGRLNRNLDIPRRFGLTKRLKEVPVVLVVDPETERIVNMDDVDGLVDARLSTPQALARWLARWVK
jgi:thiol-disulfide isomerase/thioredoxin